MCFKDVGSLPSKSLSIYELQHITSNVKHWLPVPFQHLLGEDPRGKTLYGFTNSTQHNQSCMNHGWDADLPPEELSQKRVKHREDKVHHEQAIQLLAHKALPALRDNRRTHVKGWNSLFHASIVSRGQSFRNEMLHNSASPHNYNYEEFVKMPVTCRPRVSGSTAILPSQRKHSTPTTLTFSSRFLRKQSSHFLSDSHNDS